MKKSFADFKVVEFSPSQQCFHVQTVKGMLRNNIRVFKGESIADYICIGIFETDEELQTFLDKAYEVLDHGRTFKRTPVSQEA